jgi:hypothetical protein
LIRPSGFRSAPLPSRKEVYTLELTLFVLALLVVLSLLTVLIQQIKR